MIGFNVKIPYVAGKGWFGDKIAHISHKGWISLLPDSPGRIILEYITAREREERKIISQLYTQSSKEEGEDQSIIDRTHILAPESGWSLIKGSSELHIIQNQGKDNSWKFASEEPQKVTCQITTQKHSSDKDSGQLTFEIRAVMIKTNTGFEQRREEFNLKWGGGILS